MGRMECRRGWGVEGSMGAVSSRIEGGTGICL